MVYVHLGTYTNPDGTITSYGYNLEHHFFIQKVWKSTTEFKIVGIFREKQSFNKPPKGSDLRENLRSL
jgi:hypothetical protein